MKDERHEGAVDSLSINNNIEEYHPGDLYVIVSRCVENYKDHYGEMPTAEMVSDILDIPVPVVEKVLETIELTTPQKR